jgi:UDP-N-acetylglucosamine 2-epimerase
MHFLHVVGARPNFMRVAPVLHALSKKSAMERTLVYAASTIEMQIHLMTIAKHLRLRYIQSRRIEFEAGLNLRSKYEFVMYPEARIFDASEAIAS